jgi:two-component system sensor histidine kinase/response regulator
LLTPLVAEPHAAHKDVSLTTRAVLEESPQKLNILLAEDNAVNRVLAQKLLQKQGHTVTSVNNGIDALQLWEENQSRQFDIILMDVQMPEMDGLQAATRIRERELGTGAHIPIIAVTAHAMKGDRERCLAAGMDGYIAKPINPGELAKVIQATVPSGTKIAAVPSDPIPKGPSDTELLARFDGDSELLKELAGIFLHECPRMLDEIRAALGAADSKALERAAHTLKGSVGNFAMPGPWESAQRLELLAKSGQLSGVQEIFPILEQQIARFNQILARHTAEPAHQPLCTKFHAAKQAP